MREPRGVPGTHIGGVGKSVAEPYPLGPVELAGGKEIQGTSQQPGASLTTHCPS